MSTTTQPDAPSVPVVPEPATAEPKPTPKPAPTKKRSAAKPKLRQPAKGKAKSAKPKPTAKKASKYPPEIVAAVAAGRALSGMKSDGKGGSVGPMTVSYSGPAQHVRVRARVTELLDGNPTAESILRLAGMKSLAELKRIASWEADKSALAPLRPLSKEFADDGWASGRYLASILVAWCDQIRAEAKSANMRS
jgi:hypothetical protein